MVNFIFKMYYFHSCVFNGKSECISFQFPIPNSKDLLLYSMLVFLRLLRVLQDCKSYCFLPRSFVAKIQSNSSHIPKNVNLMRLEEKK